MRVKDIVIYQSLGHCHISELGTMSLIRVGDIVIDENIDGNIVIDKIRGNCHQWELGTLTLMRIGDNVIDESWGYCHQ